MNSNPDSLDNFSILFQRVTTDRFTRGFFAINLWHSSFQCDLSGLKQPLSSGCEKCIVLGRRAKIITFSLAASLDNSGWNGHQEAAAKV